jgi:predicted small lipoprotein YifL
MRRARGTWTALWLALAALAACGIKGEPVPPGPEATEEG